MARFYINDGNKPGKRITGFTWKEAYQIQQSSVLNEAQYLRLNPNYTPTSPQPPQITSANSANGQVGVAFSYQITATNNPTSFNASGLPAGLSVNTSTGLIDGMPTNPFSGNITVMATNAGGTGQLVVAVTIAIAPPVITSALNANGSRGVAFNYAIVATNAPTSYGAVGLPAGLNVNATSGVISGIPTVGFNGNVQISATNASGTDTKNLALNINPMVPVITSALTANGSPGTPFNYTITATNTPTSFNATGLPAGLSVNVATGVISGTPAGSFAGNVVISATNAGGTDTKNLTLTIAAAAPVITSALTASGQSGVAFSYQIVATNSPTSYGASGLPAGLSVNPSTGLISGTPSAIATTNVTISATNASGSDSKVLVITVTAEVLYEATINHSTSGAGCNYDQREGASFWVPVPPQPYSVPSDMRGTKLQITYTYTNDNGTQCFLMASGPGADLIKDSGDGTLYPISGSWQGMQLANRSGVGIVKIGASAFGQTGGWWHVRHNFGSNTPATGTTYVKITRLCNNCT